MNPPHANLNEKYELASGLDHDNRALSTEILANCRRNWCLRENPNTLKLLSLILHMSFLQRVYWISKSRGATYHLTRTMSHNSPFSRKMHN